ncbi:MAG: alpha/beta fold hydrolase [Steroidobacteraceae bacterium]
MTPRHALKPFYINDCLCWLHPGSSQRGVVLCSPIGLEDLVMHRFLRRLACNIAEAGMPALRFDYRGTGDSAGSETDPDTVQAWLANVRKAVKWLREEAAVTQVILVGFRAGGLLAAHVAAQLGDIAALVLVGPVVSGSAYVREARALRSFEAQSGEPETALPSPSADDSGGLNVAGFHLSMATIRDLRRLDLRALTQSPAPRVLLLGRSNSPADRRLGEFLRTLGADVSVGILPGFASMQWNSSLAALPQDAFAGLVAWLRADAPPGRAVRFRLGSSRLVSSEWREEPVQFGPDEGLFAIHCMPRFCIPRSAVLIVNHGLNRHIGWARTYVSLARRLAAQGVASLRMDISGVGDSATAPGRPEQQLYARESVADVKAALDWLHQLDYEQITLVGHSAGAHLSFHTAVEDKRVTGLAMINMTRFVCDPMEPADYGRRKTIRSTGWYWSNIVSIDVWRRLARGRVHVIAIAEMIAGRLLRRAAVSLMSLFGKSIRAKVGHTQIFTLFRQLSERGTKVLLIYSSGDEGLDELALYCGRGGRRLAKLENFQLRIMDDADHNLTSRRSQELYFTLLERHVGLTRQTSAIAEQPASSARLAAGAC